jgi:glycosyltransferase involved in cell wall biosynthesis
MKVLLVNTSDIQGGAARAVYRLHQGLQSINVSSQMLVQVKQSENHTVIGSRAESGIGKARTGLRLTLEKLPLKFYSCGGNINYSSHWLPDNVNAQITKIAPDIINLNWISGGYLQIESIAKFNKPLVWTLHDMWAFTGGCHYNQECQKYTLSCGACPQLVSKKDGDLSRWVWQRKAKAWQNLNLTIVSPSHWLAEQAKSSSLFQSFPIKVIPHGLDLAKYKPVSQITARELLGLPLKKQLVLFGAAPGSTGDTRKGLQFLQPAIQKLQQQENYYDLELVIFGATKPQNPTDLGFPVYYLGRFHDDISLALVYSAADVMVVPSMQEAFGQTALESLACGTPVVAFNTTGLKDIVNHQNNGYLAQPFEIEDLAKGIAWVLKDSDLLLQLRHQARRKAEREYALEIQANRYLSLFQEVLEHKT